MSLLLVTQMYILFGLHTLTTVDWRKLVFRRCCALLIVLFSGWNSISVALRTHLNFKYTNVYFWHTHATLQPLSTARALNSKSTSGGHRDIRITQNTCFNLGIRNSQMVSTRFPTQIICPAFPVPGYEHPSCFVTFVHETLNILFFSTKVYGRTNIRTRSIRDILAECSIICQ